MKSRQWLIAIGLLLLVLVAVVGSILTSDLGAPQPQTSSSHRAPLVDERPLQTARTVAKLASGWDEQRFADQALRLSDNEVDLAFEDALRDAANHPVPPTPATQELYAHVTQGEADVKADQDQHRPAEEATCRRHRRSSRQRAAATRSGPGSTGA